MMENVESRIKRLPPEIDKCLHPVVEASLPGRPYVKMPIGTSPPPPQLTTPDETRTVDVILQLATGGSTDGDKLLKGLHACDKLGVYPPEWIMKAINKNFSRHISDNQAGKLTASLDQCFYGKDRRSMWWKDVQDYMLADASIKIYCLTKWFDMQVGLAIDILSYWLEEQYSNLNLGWRGKRLKGAAALRQHYYGGGRKKAMKVCAASAHFYPDITPHMRALVDSLATCLPNKESLYRQIRQRERAIKYPEKGAPGK